VTDAAIAELGPVLGVRAACEAVGAAQASYYRRHRKSPAPARSAPIPRRHRLQPRALTKTEQRAIPHELHSDHFADLAPAQVWAILLDDGRYLGSIARFYRLLRLRADGLVPVCGVSDASRLSRPDENLWGSWYLGSRNDPWLGLSLCRGLRGA